MPDFTLSKYRQLLETLKGHGYAFTTFAGFMKGTSGRTVILRHDVDAKKMNSLHTAHMENELGITGTYYFRMVPGSYDEEVIRQIHELGHEIGYHYEDPGLVERQKTKDKRQKKEGKRQKKGVRDGRTGLHDRQAAGRQDKTLTEEMLASLAIVSFRENLAKLRRIVPVETICMHGSPLSRRDNRLLWKYYDYREFGITGEPYLDIDFSEVLYLTDTGRRWDGEAVSVRDKVKVEVQSVRGRGEEEVSTAPDPGTRIPAFRSTSDIIKAAGENRLPGRIMITIHPQRWTDNPLPWIQELLWQNIKNLGKRIIVYGGSKKRLRQS